MGYKELFRVIMTKYGDVLAHVPGTKIPVYIPSGILQKLATMFDEPFDLAGNYLNYNGWQKKKRASKNYYGCRRTGKKTGAKEKERRDKGIRVRT